MTRRPGSDSEEQRGVLSALRDPVGPKDRSVYMRRRIIVLLGVVAVVVAIVLIVVRPGSGQDGGAGDAKTVAVPDDLTEKPKTKSAKGENPACEASQLEVTAVTNQTSYGPDEKPQISLAVKNIGTKTCVADLGTAGMTFKISSGSDEVWRSTDCQTNPTNLPVVLQAGERLESESVQWDRTRSSTETCEIARDPVVAGGASYHLQAAVGGMKSADTAQFLLF